MTHTLLAHLPLLILLTWAAVSDLRERRIRNWLTLLLLIGGVAQSLSVTGTVSPLGSLAGAGVGIAVTLPLFVLGAVGGGDVKLMAGVGAWIGPLPTAAVFVVEKVLGLILVLTQAAVQHRTGLLFRNSAVAAVSLLHLRQVGLDHAVRTGRDCRSVARPLPFAVPVLAAVIAVLLRTGSHG